MADVKVADRPEESVEVFDREMFGEVDATLVQGKSLGMSHPESARAQLKGMVMFLAQGGMGQRVHARTGNLMRAFALMAEAGDELDALAAAGAINESQRQALESLIEQLEVVRGREPRIFPSDEETAKGFEFLWSTTFEDDDDWNELRRRAKRCFTALRRADQPLVG